MDTCSMSYEGVGTSTAVTNTGASGVPLVECCLSRCVTEVGVMDFCGAVRLTEHLHGDNAALVISPHHFGIVRWSHTRSTLGIKSISSTGSVFHHPSQEPAAASSQVSQDKFVAPWQISSDDAFHGSDTGGC